MTVTTIPDIGNVVFDGSYSTLYAQWEVDTEDLFQATVYTPDGKVDFVQGGIHDIQIDWGDGTIEEHTDNYGETVYSHDFGMPGTYLISIGGWFELHSIRGFRNVVSILSWGNSFVESGMDFFDPSRKPYFESIVATDSPIFKKAQWHLTGPSMSKMFEDLDLTNCVNIKYWDTSDVVDMSSLFVETSSNSTVDISSWDVSSVQKMGGIFRLSEVNFGDLSSWNTANVTRMNSMFSGYTGDSYNSISSWDVSNVESFYMAFLNTPSFNTDISGWNTYAAIDMGYMFSGASGFNQDISEWYVSLVKNFEGMFENATSFDQDLSAWDIQNAENMDRMFAGVKLSTENYDAILIGWERKHWLQIPSGIVFDGGNSQYSAGAAAEARQRLIDDHGWVISDGGQAP